MAWLWPVLCLSDTDIICDMHILSLHGPQVSSLCLVLVDAPVLRSCLTCNRLHSHCNKKPQTFCVRLAVGVVYGALHPVKSWRLLMYTINGQCMQAADNVNICIYNIRCFNFFPMPISCFTTRSDGSPLPSQNEHQSS